jgi:hypothetical protein
MMLFDMKSAALQLQITVAPIPRTRYKTISKKNIQNKFSMDSLLNKPDDDDDSDDESLFQPSGLLKSPPTATKTTSCGPNTNILVDIACPQRRNDHNAIVISQEESPSSSSLVSSLQQPQQTSTKDSATKTTADDGKHTTNNAIIGNTISIEESIKEGSRNSVDRSYFESSSLSAERISLTSFLFS